MRSEILLIDDEKDIRFAVHEILKENNFFVREADTVEKALSEIKKKLPDLVILDVLLDEKNRDGIDILKFIKSIDADVPVIMISGHANIKIAVDSIKLGAFEFLEKPFNKTERGSSTPWWPTESTLRTTAAFSTPYLFAFLKAWARP